jgi:hypothetical protein
MFKLHYVYTTLYLPYYTEAAVHMGLPAGIPVTQVRCKYEVMIRETKIVCVHNHSYRIE